MKYIKKCQLTLADPYTNKGYFDLQHIPGVPNNVYLAFICSAETGSIEKTKDFLKNTS